MKTAVLDVGSNSVRMIVFDEDKAVFRGKINSRLGEKINERRTLYPEAVARTLAALSSLKEKARSFGVADEKIFAFATAAVRRAEDGRDFLLLVKDVTGIETELISGEKEAEIGLIGALNGKDGAILDIGGASSELAVRTGGKTVYEKSLQIGAGVLTDRFGIDRVGLKKFVSETIKGYGAVPRIDELTLIGGTASACALIEKKLKDYDYDGINGTVLSSDGVRKTADALFSLSVAGRMEKYNLDENRATVLPCGAALLAEIIDYTGAKTARVSECGNIEGYYLCIRGGENVEQK